MADKGWLRIRTAAKYADVCDRTFRDYLKTGLKHVRLPSGTVLTRPEWVDEYFQQFEQGSRADAVVSEMLRGF